jgi:hypothetical protein
MGVPFLDLVSILGKLTGPAHSIRRSSLLMNASTRSSPLQPLLESTWTEVAILSNYYLGLI